MESPLSIFECIGTMNRLEEPWFLKKPVKCLLCFLSAPPRLRVNLFPQVHGEPSFAFQMHWDHEPPRVAPATPTSRSPRPFKGRGPGEGYAINSFIFDSNHKGSRFVGMVILNQYSFRRSWSGFGYCLAIVRGCSVTVKNTARPINIGNGIINPPHNQSKYPNDCGQPEQNDNDAQNETRAK